MPNCELCEAENEYCYVVTEYPEIENVFFMSRTLSLLKFEGICECRASGSFCSQVSLSASSVVLDSRHRANMPTRKPALAISSQVTLECCRITLMHDGFQMIFSMLIQPLSRYFIESSGFKIANRS